jgi:hypothetical protein
MLIYFSPGCRVIERILILKLEEEENITLLLLLPAVFAETTDLWSASGFCCCLVVGDLQAVQFSAIPNQHSR